MQTISPWFFPVDYRRLTHELILSDAIEDRGSRYTISAFPLQHLDEVQNFVAACDPEATHNSFAWRVLQADGTVFQDSDDDGETGAGACILRELVRYQAVDMLLIVTRYFWWVKLETDRYKHIVDGCRMVLERIS